MHENNGFELDPVALETIAAQGMFRGVVYKYGVENIQAVIAQADQAIENGLKGVTLEGDYDDEVFVVTINADQVNMRFFRGAAHSLPRNMVANLLHELASESEI